MFYMYISVFPVYIGTAAARISIGLTLLRLKQDSRIWTWAIWTLNLVLMVQGGANTVIQVTQCLPTEALWSAEARVGAKCMSIELSRVWGWTSSGGCEVAFILIKHPSISSFVFSLQYSLLGET
jgi:hypothetical protein